MAWSSLLTMGQTSPCSQMHIPVRKQGSATGTECLQWGHYWGQRWYKGSDPAMELPGQAALPAVGWVPAFP